VIPDAHVYYRRGLALKRVIPQCVSRGFTYLMVINEDRKMPSILKDYSTLKTPLRPSTPY
jgi:rRNA maturation protein Rpf1